MGRAANALAMIGDDSQRVLEIAIGAFAKAKEAALAENDRLGIPSYGSKDGKIVVTSSPETQQRKIQELWLMLLGKNP